MYLSPPFHGIYAKTYSFHGGRVSSTLTHAAEQVAGANDGWPSQFRFAGDVLVSVMAQLRMLGGLSSSVILSHSSRTFS